MNNKDKTNLPALLPGFRPPAMPISQRYPTALRPWRYESGAINWNWIQYSQNTLIPAEHCRAIIAELEAAAVPAPLSVAAQLAKLLVGSYPAREVNDAQIFVKVLASTLAEYPADIGLRAIDDMTRTQRWLPTRAEVVTACDRLIEERHYARQVVDAHLAKHDEIRAASGYV